MLGFTNNFFLAVSLSSSHPFAFLIFLLPCFAYMRWNWFLLLLSYFPCFSHLFSNLSAIVLLLTRTCLLFWPFSTSYSFSIVLNFLPTFAIPEYHKISSSLIHAGTATTQHASQATNHKQEAPTRFVESWQDSQLRNVVSRCDREQGYDVVPAKNHGLLNLELCIVARLPDDSCIPSIPTSEIW